MGSPGSKGFTLLELMITLVVIVSIVVGVLPNLSSFVNRNRAASTTNDFLATLQYARSEALSRGTRVILCRRPQITDADAACTDANLTIATHCSCETATTDTTADGWEDGWLVVADADRSATVTAGDNLLRLQGAIGGGYSLRGNSNVANTIHFDQNATAITSGTLFLCASGSDTAAGSERMRLARKIAISFVGHATASAFSGSDSCFP